jgi:hypothetical protein|tara:strand:+ start:483 stop:722 length:240 start_codon:yes stop_codon:yes gene_type:complete
MLFKLTDEILNCYVDNELTETEIKIVHMILDASSLEDVTKYMQKIKDIRMVRNLFRSHVSDKFKDLPKSEYLKQIEKML